VEDIEISARLDEADSLLQQMIIENGDDAAQQVAEILATTFYPISITTKGGGSF